MLKRITTSDQLMMLRDKLTPPTAWHQGAGFARNSEGTTVSPHSKEAVCWCAQGAVQAIVGEHVEARESDLYKAIMKAINGDDFGPYGCSVVSFNESPGRTHQDVLEFIDKAIEMELAPAA